jgi:hypothetical protein
MMIIMLFHLNILIFPKIQYIKSNSKINLKNTKVKLNYQRSIINSTSNNSINLYKNNKYSKLDYKIKYYSLDESKI